MAVELWIAAILAIFGIVFFDRGCPCCASARGGAYIWWGLLYNRLVGFSRVFLSMTMIPLPQGFVTDAGQSMRSVTL